MSDDSTAFEELAKLEEYLQSKEYAALKPAEKEAFRVRYLAAGAAARKAAGRSDRAAPRMPQLPTQQQQKQEE